MAEPAGEVEDLHRSRASELVARDVDRSADDIEVLHHIVAGEQVVRERPPVAEELGRQLAAQHLPVGDALARVGFRHRVEALHADGREEEQERATVRPR